MNVGILDRRPLLAIGLRAALDGEEGISVVEAFTTSGPLRPETLDVLVLDSAPARARPGLDGLRALAGQTNVIVATALGAADPAPYLQAGAKQTARRLKISKHTVDTYIKRARVKLRLGNKADLTRAALGDAVLR